MGSPSSLRQDTLGVGLPVARQLRVALSPSETAKSALVSPPYTISGGTVGQKYKESHKDVNFKCVEVLE